MINIVLYEPEIPQNTGNIMRTCVATNSKLHLIKPLGFKLDDNHMRRCAVNYLENLNYEVYENWDDFKDKNKGTYYYLTRYGKKPHTSFDYSNNKENIYLIFGKESTGIPKEILKDDLKHCMRIPMTDKVRALNVSNSVAIMVYEVLRQQNFNDLSFTEPFKGVDYLEKWWYNPLRIGCDIIKKYILLLIMLVVLSPIRTKAIHEVIDSRCTDELKISLREEASLLT